MAHAIDTFGHVIDMQPMDKLSNDAGGVTICNDRGYQCDDKNERVNCSLHFVGVDTMDRLAADEHVAHGCDGEIQ